MKVKKIATIIVIIMLVMPTLCFAKVDTDSYKPKDLTVSDYQKAFEMTGTIVNIVTVIGVVVSILGLMVLGIKYMVGSVEEKSQYKKSMIPYILGCVFIFAITTIVSIIYNLATKL